MRKNFFKFSFFLLCGCFALLSAHANDQVEVRAGGMKRLLQTEQGEDQPDSKRQRTVTPTSWECIPEDIRKAINVYLPPNEVWKSRLLNHHWWRAVNASITSLDLSPIRWTPWKRRAELRSIKDPVEIDIKDYEAYYCDGLDNEGLQKWKKYQHRDCHTVSLGEGSYGRAYTYGNKFASRVVNSLIYCDGELFLQAPLFSSICYTTSGEEIWKTDALIFGSFKIDNPFKVHFSDILMDLSEFPNLKELNLRNNTAITDSHLIKATSLSTLDFRNTPGVTIQALHKMPNLKIVKFDQCQEMGDFFQLPNIQEVHYLAAYWNPGDPCAKQQMMYIAEALFSLIDKDVALTKRGDFILLKNRYERRILLPNNRDLGATQRKTTYPFNFETYVYTAEDVDYVQQLTRAKYESDSKFLSWEERTDIYEIIIDLIKISGKDLNVFVERGKFIISLEEIMQNEKRE